MRASRYNDAHGALDEALLLVEKNDDRFQEAELVRLRGELLLAESAIPRPPRTAFVGRLKLRAASKAAPSSCAPPPAWRASGADRAASTKLIQP